MRLSEMNLPVPTHPTFDILDASKLNEGQTCWRKFFFRYVLGWEKEGRRHDLEFGTAWHIAKDHLLLNGYSEESAEAAHEKFLEHYRKFFGQETDLDYAPKSPGNALIALLEFCQQFGLIDSGHEVLHTEVLAKVPISLERERYIYCRLDHIGRSKQFGIFSFDHKTSKYYTSYWGDQWRVSFQMLAYTHVITMMFPDEPVFGMLVDGTIFYKNKQKGLTTKNRYVRVPLQKQDELMNDWLYHANHLYDLLEWNFEALSKLDPSAEVMQAFPKCTKSCFDYNKPCPYFELCSTSANPIHLGCDPPIGYAIKYWNPADDESRPKPKKEVSL